MIPNTLKTPIKQEVRSQETICTLAPDSCFVKITTKLRCHTNHAIAELLVSLELEAGK